MAKVRGPLLSESVTGGFGGVLVFWLNEGRQLAAGASVQGRSRTPSQSEKRNDWSYWSKVWKGLDDWEREWWNQWAKDHPRTGNKPLGGSGEWTGFDWFVYYNGGGSL